MKIRILIPAIITAIALIAAACGSGGNSGASNVSVVSPATAERAAPATTERVVPTTEMPTTTTVAPTTTTLPEPTKIGLVYDIGGRGDHSFNDFAFAGLDRAKDELGVQGSESLPNGDGSGRARLLELQARQSDLVFGVGFLFEDSLLAAAEQFPNTNFAIIDDSLGNATPSNAAGLVFAEDEGSCLVGAAAALKTSTGKIGFIGGVRLPLVEKFERGFEVCAKDLANANGDELEILSEYITEPPDYTGFMILQ